MSEAPQKEWYSYQRKRYPYEGPYYFDVDQMPWVEEFKTAIPQIREEVMGFVQREEQRLAPYFNKDLVSGPTKWKALSFKFWGLRFKKNAGQIPISMAALDQIPGLVSASISMLEPQTEIHPHRGDTNTIMRWHLGLEIPEPLPNCGFKVGQEERSWTNGGLLAFNDAENHQAWNLTDQRRFLLLFDVIRPEFMERKKAICARVLSSLFWQFMGQKSVLFRGWPMWLLNVTVYPVARLVFRFLV